MELFNTDATWRILRYFIQYSTKETYPRELERTLKISSGSTSTICKKLEKWGILTFSKIAKAHLYKLNNENVFVKRLKVVWFLGWLMKYRKFFENEEFQAVALYGSYANGEFHEQSDVDLLVITNMEKKQTRELFKNIEKDLFAPQLSLTIFTLTQWKALADKNDRFYKEVLANHMLLYGTSILLG